MNVTWLQEDFKTTSSLLFNNDWIYYNSSYNSSYDYDELYEVPTGIIIILSICYGSISTLAIAGNFLVMWIVWTSKRMQTVTNYFIANLALADIVIGLFAIPFQDSYGYGRIIHEGSKLSTQLRTKDSKNQIKFQAALLQRWNLPDFMCAFCPFVQVLSVNVSVFTLTAIAVDRHRAILRPLSRKPTKLRAKIIIASIWILAGALATPMAIALRVVMVNESIEDGRLRMKPFCKNINMSEDSMLIYRALLGSLQYVTPLMIISWAYARMALELWGSRAPGNAEDSRDATFMKNKKKVIKMMVTVVAMFMICWLPLQMYNVLQYTYPTINEYRYINIIWFCCDWLAMSNSCCNPFIYGIYNENFKREFKQRCPFRPHKWSPSPPTDSMDVDKTQSTRMSIRYDVSGRSTGFGGYSNSLASFRKDVSIRKSKTETPIDNNELKSITNLCTKNGQNNEYSVPKSNNKTTQLYVFSSGRHKRTEDFDTQELCL